LGEEGDAMNTIALTVGYTVMGLGAVAAIVMVNGFIIEWILRHSKDQREFWIFLMQREHGKAKKGEVR
jgi:hypothetical protein